MADEQGNGLRRMAVLALGAAALGVLLFAAVLTLTRSGGWDREDYVVLGLAFGLLSYSCTVLVGVSPLREILALWDALRGRGGSG